MTSLSRPFLNRLGCIRKWGWWMKISVGSRRDYINSQCLEFRCARSIDELRIVRSRRYIIRLLIFWRTGTCHDPTCVLWNRGVESLSQVSRFEKSVSEKQKMAQPLKSRWLAINNVNSSTLFPSDLTFDRKIAGSGGLVTLIQNFDDTTVLLPLFRYVFGRIKDVSLSLYGIGWQSTDEWRLLVQVIRIFTWVSLS